jgi:hypothetical protein
MPLCNFIRSQRPGSGETPRPYSMKQHGPALGRGLREITMAAMLKSKRSSRAAQGRMAGPHRGAGEMKRRRQRPMGKRECGAKALGPIQFARDVVDPHTDL